MRVQGAQMSCLLVGHRPCAFISCLSLLKYEAGNYVQSQTRLSAFAIRALLRRCSLNMTLQSCSWEGDQEAEL